MIKFKRAILSSILLLTAGFSIALLVSASAPVSGAYLTDITQVYVNNIAQNSVQQVNQILCMISHTNFPNHTNTGPYLALVDQNVCNQSGSSGSSSSDQASQSASVPNYMQFYINATRGTGSNDPENADIWVYMTNNNGGSATPVLIYAKMSVRSSPTTTNPYGDFTMNYVGYLMDGATVTNTIAMKGFIQTAVDSATGNVILQHVDTSSGGQGHDSSALLLVGNGTTNGYGAASQNSSPYYMSYNSSNLLVKQTGQNAVCYDRNNVTNLINQYGVYTSTGDRLNHNAGIPFTLTSTGEVGFIGYFGAWLPSGIAPTNGEAASWTDADNNKVTGTVVATQGKLMQMTAQTFTLNQLAGVQMSLNSSTPFTSSIITWDSTDQVFKKLGTQTCDQNGCSSTMLSTPVTESAGDFAASVYGFSMGSGPGIVQLWINGLGNGGQTQLTIFESCTFGSCSSYITPTNSTSLNIWVNSLVPPTSSSISQTLYCLQQCPMSADGEFTNVNPFFDGSGGVNKYLTYTLYPGLGGSNKYILLDADSNPVIVTDPLQNIMTGPLLTASQYESIVVNGEPQIQKLTDGTISSYYSWSSGGQSFNKFYTLEDGSGNLVNFDSPLQLVYVDSVGGHNFLQYISFGNLQGIPGVCTDANGNVTNNCSTPGSVWTPSYSIPNGTALTTMDGGSTYWVKALSEAQVMNIDNSSACSSLDSGLTTAQSSTLPTISNWVAPSNIGQAVPAITVPSVINGVEQ